MARPESKAPVLCDLGGTRIRLAVEKAPGDLARDAAMVPIMDEVVTKVQERHPQRPFHGALGEFLSRLDGQEGRELRLSLPCDFTSETTFFEFPNLPKSWAFDKEQIRKEFGFSSVGVTNDAEAALFGVFKLLASPEFGPFEYAEVISARAMDAFGNMLLLGVGTGLGCTTGRREPPKAPGQRLLSRVSGDRLGWKPAGWEGRLAEAVQALRTPDNRGHSRALQQMSLTAADFDASRFDHREYLVSGPGLSRLYEYVTESKIAPIRPVPTPHRAESIVDLAFDDNDDATEAVSLFCEALGKVLADLVAEHNVRIAVYLTGPMLLSIGYEGLHEWGMLKAYERQKQRLGSDADPPIFLITHPYPELVGLSRFENLASVPRRTLGP